MGVMGLRSGTLALSTVAIVAVAAACLQTESLGSEESPVVTCDKSACTGVPTSTLCTDGRTVESTGRCVRTESGACGWEPGSCSSLDGGADAIADALTCGDGLVALTGKGPWDDAKGCWRPDLVTFQCVTTITGGTGFTCFHQISTGKFYLAETTQIPAGDDYRICTIEERDARGGLSNVCK